MAAFHRTIPNMLLCLEQKSYNLRNKVWANQLPPALSTLLSSTIKLCNIQKKKIISSPSPGMLSCSPHS